ncbi:hypothetical protein LPJ70_003193, partial [Coemansia sp. RSA 2708]
MHDGDAILGIFLATYSSKGDYLPLRYPMSKFDYEYAETLLKDIRAQRRSPRAERGTDMADTSAMTDMDPALAEQATNETVPADIRSAGAAGAATNSATETPLPSAKDTVPSRNESFSSMANVSSNPVTPGSAALSNTAFPTAHAKTTARSEGKPRAAFASSIGEHADGPRADGDVGADHRPYLAQTVHGFDTKFLAQLFSPRPSMSDQRFQVAVDNVLFVGHPLRDDPKEKTRDPDYYDAEQDETEAMSRLAEYEGWKVKSDTMLHPGSNQQGTRLLADLGLISLMLNREPSETGDSAISEGERAVRDSKEWKRRGYWKRV